jgi:invasion protein IalB
MTVGPDAGFAFKTPSLACQSVGRAGFASGNDRATTGKLPGIAGNCHETTEELSLMGLSDQRELTVRHIFRLTRLRRPRRFVAAVRRLILAGAALGLGFGLASGAASAQGAVKAVYGDWQIRCDTPAGAQNEQCALIQSVVAEDRSNAGLTVIVLKTADQKSKLMRVVAPLGVLLPSGLGLKLDDKDVGRAGFVRCLPNGCVAEVVMDDNLLNQLRTAKTATFIIFETPEEGIGFPLSLKGLADGYDKLP